MTTNKDYTLKHNNKDYIFKRNIYRNKSIIEYKSSNPKMIEVSKPSEIKYNIEDVGIKEDLLSLATPTVSKISTVSSAYFKTQDGSDITEYNFPYLSIPTSFSKAFLITYYSTTKLVFKIRVKGYPFSLSRVDFDINVVNNNTYEPLCSFDIYSYDDNLDMDFATLIIEGVNEEGCPNISVLESDKFYISSIRIIQTLSVPKRLLFYFPILVGGKVEEGYFDIKNSYSSPDEPYFIVDELANNSIDVDELMGYIEYKSNINPKDITPTVEITKVTNTTKELVNTKTYTLKRKVN